ncbi:MAG: ABC transporter ATP-binding protein [Acidobacteria bacterium]|nr:ABC transporter ATP-binding protein [Acidobacteriota bacterium]
MLEIRDLDFAFGRKPIYRNLNLAIPSGQVVLVTGINGAGKSTLLRLVAGVLKPARGTISLDPRLGRDPRAKIGFISDRLSLYESLRVDQLIRLHLSLFHVEQFDDSLIRHTRIGLRQRIKELSIGQRTILHLALILSPKPDLLLIDEVIHDLDAYLRRLFLDEIIRQLSEREMTVIMVNVNFHDIESLVDRVVMLRDGEIAVDESIESLKQKVKKIVSREEQTRLPVLFQREYSDRREYVVYPFDERSLDGVQGDVVDLNLNDIVAAFIAGEYA